MSSRPTQLALLALALCSSNYARTALNPLQEQIGRALDLGDSQIAILQGPALVAPFVVAAIPVGILADRFSRARLVWAAVAVACGASVATAFAKGFPTLLVLRSVVGLATGAISIGVLSLVADHFDRAVRGRANMVVALAEVGGASGAFAAGGWLSASWARTGDSGWSSAMLWMAIPIAVAAIFTGLLRDAPSTARHEGLSSSAVKIGELWRLRGILFPLIAAKILAVTAYAAIVTWAAPVLQRSFSVTPQRAAGTLATTLLVAGIAGPLAGGLLADLAERLGGPRTTLRLLILLAIIAVPASLFSMLPSIVEASALLIIFTTFIAIISVIEMTLTTILVPNAVRGLALSVMVTLGLVVGFGAAPVIVAEVSAVIGRSNRLGAALSITCAVSALLGAASFIAGRKYLPRDSRA